MPRIDRCVCTRRTFAELLALARANNWSLDELGKCTGATRQCGRCQPYLCRTLRTGQTVFDHLLPAAPPDTEPTRGQGTTRTAAGSSSRFS